MTPRETVASWVEAFNRADVDALAALYAESAVNHPVAETPIEGRASIRAMFARATMVCVVENLFEDDLSRRERSRWRNRRVRCDATARTRVAPRKSRFSVGESSFCPRRTVVSGHRARLR